MLQDRRFTAPGAESWRNSLKEVGTVRYLITSSFDELSLSGQLPPTIFVISVSRARWSPLNWNYFRIISARGREGKRQAVGEVASETISRRDFRSSKHFYARHARLSQVLEFSSQAVTRRNGRYFNCHFSCWTFSRLREFLAKVRRDRLWALTRRE